MSNDEPEPHRVIMIGNHFASPLLQRFRCMSLIKRTITTEGTKVYVTELRKDHKTNSKQLLKYTLDLP